jgi:hypothetical protein
MKYFFIPYAFGIVGVDIFGVYSWSISKKFTFDQKYLSKKNNYNTVMCSK